MQNVMQIGSPPWTRDEIMASIDEFSEIYANRPIKDNRGGMKAPHMFGAWFMAKKLSPDLIVESGIWKGQGTWLLEKACPTAKLVSIDLNLDLREYVSDKAVYLDKDFSEHVWLEVTDNSLAFFDDHQNAYKRLKQCQWAGFKHMIFEDNYPIKQGDCYSLKKAFANAGFEPEPPRQQTTDNSVASKVRGRLVKLLRGNTESLVPQNDAMKIEPNDFDSRMLKKNLGVYYEFPPVFKTRNTRWGDEWDETFYPTSKPLLEKSTKKSHELFVKEALDYTWICYAKLK